MDYGQVKTWISSAKPEELTDAGRVILNRIAGLPREHRDRFSAEVITDPTVQRLFEKTTV